MQTPETQNGPAAGKDVFAVHARAFEAAQAHAASCSRCFVPIVDPEGNPGYFGEACPAGAALLRVYVDAEKDVLAWLSAYLPACEERSYGEPDHEETNQ